MWDKSMATEAYYPNVIQVRLGFQNINTTRVLIFLASCCHGFPSMT